MPPSTPGICRQGGGGFKQRIVHMSFLNLQEPGNLQWGVPFLCLWVKAFNHWSYFCMMQPTKLPSKLEAGMCGFQGFLFHSLSLLPSLLVSPAQWWDAVPELQQKYSSCIFSNSSGNVGCKISLAQVPPVEMWGSLFHTDELISRSDVQGHSERWWWRGFCVCTTCV